MSRIARTCRLAALLAATAALTATAQPPPAGQPGQLHITSEPSDAAVTLNGESRGVTPLTLASVPPGTYLVTINRRQHRTARRTVRIEPGARVAEHIELEPLLGLLLIHTQPAGADIQINGVDRGTGPLLVTDLPLREHRVRVSRPNYIAKDVTVTLTDRVPVKLEVDLTPDYGSLVIRSTPPGARIQLDGVSHGATPATLERVATGSAVLQLALEGHAPFREQVRVSAGERQTLDAVLQPIPATLQVVTVPEAARVYVDNQFRGNAPVRLDDLPPETYRVRVELEAFDPMARDVTLGLADSRVEEFRLVSNSGSLDITTEPALVTVFVDGTEMGTTPVQDNRTDRVSSESLRIDRIPTGERELQLVRSGYRTRTETVTIVRDQTTIEHYTLDRLFIPNFEVITASEVYRGVLESIDANGNVRLELRPGIMKTIQREEIRERRALRALDPDAAVAP